MQMSTLRVISQQEVHLRALRSEVVELNCGRYGQQDAVTGTWTLDLKYPPMD